MVSLSSHKTVKTGNRPRAPLPPLALSPTAVAAAAAAAAAPLPEEPEMCKENQCIPYAFRENNRRVSCTNYAEAKCFPPSDVEMEFYEKINWPVLRRIINTEMNNFMNLLNILYNTPEAGFNELVNSVYPGITARVNRNELFLKAADLVNEQQHPCNDVNYSFSIECQRHAPGGPGGTVVSGSDTASAQGLRLFHIAVHSEMPKYHKKDEGRTRSQYACGYFERKSLTGKDAEVAAAAAEGAAKAGVPQGSGPFHYKIDNYDILVETTKEFSKSKCGVKIEELQCPFKRFEPETDSIGRATGKFQVLHGDNVGFVNLFAPWCTAVSFSPRFKNADLRTSFAQLHSYIYNKFVTFWNDEIFPKVSIDLRVAEIRKTMVSRKIGKAIISSRKKLSPGSRAVKSIVSSLVSHVVRSGKGGGSRKRNAKRRITKKMKNSRRRVKK